MLWQQHWRQRLTALTKPSRNWPQKAKTRTKCDRGMIMDKTDAAALMAFFLFRRLLFLGLFRW